MDERYLSSDYWLLVAQATRTAKRNSQTAPSHVAKTCIENWKACVSCCDDIPSIETVLDVALPPNAARTSQREVRKIFLKSIAERCMSLDVEDGFAGRLVILAFGTIAPLSRWHVQYFVKKLQMAATNIVCMKAPSQQDLLVGFCGVAPWVKNATVTIEIDVPKPLVRICSKNDKATIGSPVFRLLGSVALSCPAGLTQVAGLLQEHAQSNDRHLAFAAASALMDAVYLNVALMDGGWQDFLLDMVSSFISQRSPPYVQFTAVVCATRMLMFKSDWCEATGNVEAILEDIIDQRQAPTGAIKEPPKEQALSATKESRLPDVDDSMRLIGDFLKSHSQNFPDHIANGCVYQICKALKSGVLLICSSEQYGLRIEDNVAKQSEADRLTNACRSLFSLLCSHEVPIPLGDVFEAIRKNLYQTNVTTKGIQAWVVDKGLIPQG
ncbi:hypothetical protein BSKO_05061 [Bryopsis sp. KO-2023]|nr:hypothetical protein BSKO_05061 [Bryopsis sp. KO-2023]